MKKFLLALFVAAAAALIVPEVQAGHYDCGPRGRRIVLHYDYCGRPVYGYIRDDYRHHYGRRHRRHYYGNYDYYPRYSYRPSSGLSFYISR
jgi:hypothetical protein